MPTISAKNLTKNAWSLISDDTPETFIRCRNRGAVLMHIGATSPALNSHDYITLSPELGGVRVTSLSGSTMGSKLWLRASEDDVTVEVATGLKVERLN